MRLFPREKKFFDLLEAHIEHSVEAARLLFEALSTGPQALPQVSGEIKRIEAEGDRITHQLFIRLNQTFVTPLDPEDLHSLGSALDDVLDIIEDAAFRLSAYRIDVIPKGMVDQGSLQKGKSPRFTHPIYVKTHDISPDPALAAKRIGQQLNLGVAGVVFVDVDSREELEQGLAAMRFKSNGGTRSDDVGDAPAMWGMTPAEYKAKADLWPLNPKGELYNFTIVESKAGLAKIREIAAVKGVGVLFPGAGTLRGVFSTTDAAGKRTFDEKAWEAAIQSVLAACKEFNVPCGYPAGAADIELRMKQGFSVFVIGWGETGFKAVEIGHGVSGR